MKMFPKAQGLSMTTIVIAALSLLVLVVLTLIFTGRMGSFSIGVEETSDCQSFCDSLGYKGPAETNPTTCTADDTKEVKAGENKCCCYR